MTSGTARGEGDLLNVKILFLNCISAKITVYNKNSRYLSKMLLHVKYKI